MGNIDLVYFADLLTLVRDAMGEEEEEVHDQI